MRVSVMYTRIYMHILVRFCSVKLESARHDFHSSLNVVCSYMHAVMLVHLCRYSFIYVIQ